MKEALVMFVVGAILPKSCVWVKKVLVEFVCASVKEEVLVEFVFRAVLPKSCVKEALVGGFGCVCVGVSCQ